MSHSRHGVVVLTILLLARIGHAQEAKTAVFSPQAIAFFEKKVRPVLAKHCLRCHGDKRQRGGLRLDSRAALLTGGDLGPAIVPGDPLKSHLIKAIGYQEDELKMPPGGKLDREDIDALTQWVKLNAPWPAGDGEAKVVRKGEMQITDKDRQHWSFQPVKRPAIPKVKQQAWVRNPIDAFILARLEAKGLAPNAPASPQQLVRRLYYDVIGLPPTPAQVEAFLKDSTPDAYDKFVDRLLASPQHGEKWARHWLDLVRYAETNSYERDNPKPHVWRYRDYVIRAFNSDKPYDRFLLEQIAGDELPGGDADALIATGYYRLGIWDDEPTDRVQARFDGLDDILATTGQAMLGLTVDCARCHDHKIDPIRQRDYYRFLAFFANINHFRNGGPTDEVAINTTEEFKQKQRAHEKSLSEVRDQIAELERQIREAAAKDGQPTLNVDIDDLTYRFYRSSWQKLPDFASLKYETRGTLTGGLFDIRPRSRDQAFGFVFDGTLRIPETGRYSFFLDSDDGARLSLAGKQIILYDGIHGLGDGRQANIELKKGDLPIRLEYFQNVGGLGLHVAWSGPGFSKRSLSAPYDRGGNSEGKILPKLAERLLGAQRYATYAALKTKLEVLKKLRIEPEKALCVTEAGRNAPESHILIRGNAHAHGDRVEPGFPLIFNAPEPSIPELPANVPSTGRRTALARWLTSPDNPLTSRVMVNRLWQFHFGRGIVRTPNDFGTQGMRPTHPQLLDWLASEFMARGWSMRQIHRLILTSNAYRMSSQARQEPLELDPENDLFWRFDMRRLSGEEIRDSILAVSGNLNPKQFGPSIYPEIPRAVLQGQSQPGRGWPTSSPEEQNRRSIYIHVKRSLLYPLLESFDLAETDRSTPVRFATTQPTQALGMLNGEFLNKQAGIFADRLTKESPRDLAGQVRRALFLTTGRHPTEAEISRGVGLIQALQSHEKMSPADSLQAFCLVALNLNEFIYLD